MPHPWDTRHVSDGRGASPYDVQYDYNTDPSYFQTTLDLVQASQPPPPPPMPPPPIVPPPPERPPTPPGGPPPPNRFDGVWATIPEEGSAYSRARSRGRQAPGMMADPMRGNTSAGWQRPPTPPGGPPPMPSGWQQPPTPPGGPPPPSAVWNNIPQSPERISHRDAPIWHTAEL